MSSSSTVALTGAGISTESGIPDYRSPGTGLWEKMDQSVVSLEGFRRAPHRYYDYALELYPVRKVGEAQSRPLYARRARKERAPQGCNYTERRRAPQDAGSEEVHELHGSLRQAVCLGCSVLEPMEDVMERVISGENPPLCRECGGVLKPNAVFFGELLPHVPWQRSLELARAASLFITIGSSLQVSPANTLPDIALHGGAGLIILNLTPTPFDEDAELVVRQKIGEFSSAVLEILGASRHKI